MKLKEREMARKMRREGKSINQIVFESGFSKSSVSKWVQDISLTADQRKHISTLGRSIDSIEKRRINRLRNEKAKRQRIIDLAKSDFKSVSVDQLKLIGIILYMGEGGKTERGVARLSNSDPEVIKIMMRFFREVCGVSEKKFRGCIHTFAHADVKKTEKYWSEITGIKTNQFYKTYVKASSASLHKRNTIPFGTFDIYVCDTRLFLTIMGWIEKVKELAVSSAIAG